MCHGDGSFHLAERIRYRGSPIHHRGLAPGPYVVELRSHDDAVLVEKEIVVPPSGAPTFELR